MMIITAKGVIVEFEVKVKGEVMMVVMSMVTSVVMCAQGCSYRSPLMEDICRR